MLMSALSSPSPRAVDLGHLEMLIEESPAGAIYARSPFAAPAFDRHVTVWLDRWAAQAPQRAFLAERREGQWHSLTYIEARSKVRALGQALLDRGLDAERPLMIVAGNSLAHALIGLAALYVGIPYAPISPATPPAKLARMITLLTPGLIFADVGAHANAASTSSASIEMLSSSEFAGLLASKPTAALDARHQEVGPDTIAKFMFTSGSAGESKAVITTHRMLCVNQAMIAHVLRFLRDEPPVLLDWLPWSHSFGGNQNFNLVLYHGGTLSIDDGKPTSSGIAVTVANLREIAPTLHFNVPRGFEMLLPHLAADKALAANFFRRAKLNFFAGAPMSASVVESLNDIARSTCCEPILSLSGYGATETAPAALFSLDGHSGGVGLPLPGSALKLVPHGEAYEARVKGPHVTPGYWREADLTRRAFDDEGYYCFGDALSFIDRNRPQRGFHFAGRLDEDFKLASGEWVSVGPLRQDFLAALAPYASEVVIAGHGKAFLSALVFPDVTACRRLADLDAGAKPADILTHPLVRKTFARRLGLHARSAANSSRRITRVFLLAEPPSVEAGEFTGKGTLSSAAVLARRAIHVEELYAGRNDPRIVAVTPACS